MIRPLFKFRMGIMVDYKELRRILNGANMSVRHYQNGNVAVTDSKRFRGMDISA